MADSTISAPCSSPAGSQCGQFVQPLFARDVGVATGRMIMAYLD